MKNSQRAQFTGMTVPNTTMAYRHGSLQATARSRSPHRDRYRLLGNESWLRDRHHLWRMEGGNQDEQTLYPWNCSLSLSKGRHARHYKEWPKTKQDNIDLHIRIRPRSLILSPLGNQCQLGNLPGRKVLSSRQRDRQSRTSYLLPSTQRLHLATPNLESVMVETLLNLPPNP